MQRIVNLIFVVFLAVEASGCMSAALLKEKQYQDKTQEWKITDDAPRLVVVGEKQTYVFDLPESLKTVLQSSYRSKLRLSIGRLSLDTNGEVTARYTIRLDKQASLQEQEAASVDGLRKPAPLALYALEGNLVGKRYDGLPAMEGMSLEGIQKSNSLQVQEERGTIEKAGRYALLPITIPVDVVVGSIVILGVAIVWGYACAMERPC